MFTFYLPENNSSYLTGTIGGDISSTLYTGYVSELFAPVTNAPSGDVSGLYQYRKLFIKNEYGSTSTTTRAWVDSIEHSGQISISLAIENDSISDSDIEPSGVSWTTPSNWAEGIDIGTLTANDYTGIWIREYLSGITESDPYATFRIGVGGLIL